MTTTVEAIYENGMLRLTQPLAIAEKTRVKLTIETDPEREAWLKASQDSLAKVWDNNADDVFNELRNRVDFFFLGPGLVLGRHLSFDEHFENVLPDVVILLNLRFLAKTL